MNDAQQDENRNAAGIPQFAWSDTSQSIDWYTEGEEPIVDVAGIQIAVRFVGRNGRRGRIAITAPPGAAFRASDNKR